MTPLKNFEFEVVTVDAFGQVKERETKEAKYFTEDLDNGITLDMVAIPEGKFKRGAPENEKGSSTRERPQDEVKIQSFFMGKFPVTQGQWRAIATPPLNPEQSFFKGDNRPVEFVTWYDAVRFCQLLSLKTGREYRLPSEAEWEYACRAGTETPFHFGETITTDLANYDGNYTYASEPIGESRGETTPVGYFKVANKFGLYDMHGNVEEWCADTWHNNYEGAPTDGSAWIKGGNNHASPSRGGSWLYDPDNCRSAPRVYDDRDNDDLNIGFRVVCAPRSRRSSGSPKAQLR